MPVLVKALTALAYFYLGLTSLHGELADSVTISTMWELFEDTVNLENLPFDVPTDDETSRGLLVPPRLYWGNQLRREKSMRFLLLGGSNTNHFGPQFITAVEARKADGRFNSDSYVQNESIGGSGIKPNLNKRFEFQDKYTTENWPNIVCMEFSVNSKQDISYLKLFDQLVHSLSYLWQSNGLSPPAFVILDLFAIGEFYSTKGEILRNLPQYPDQPHNGGHPPTYFIDPLLEPDDTSAELAEISKLNKGVTPSSRGFSRGASVSDSFVKLARFYGIPMISTIDAMFPSFTRFFVHSVDGRNDHQNQMWPFSHDGIHLSKLGQTYMLEKLLMPMLEKQLQHPFSPHDHRNSLYEASDIRLFSASNYAIPGVLASFSSWGKGTNHLKEIVLHSPGWEFVSTLYHESDGEHVCYGSSTAVVADTPARFTLHYSNRYCNSAIGQLCKLEVGYVHSWNTSYIGDAVCNIYPYDDGTGKDINSVNRLQPIIPGGGYHIQGNQVHGEAIHDTTVHMHTVTHNITKGGAYLLECEKEHNNVTQYQGRGLLSCFAEVVLLSATSAEKK